MNLKTLGTLRAFHDAQERGEIALPDKNPEDPAAAIAMIDEVLDFLGGLSHLNCGGSPCAHNLEVLRWVKRREEIAAAAPSEGSAA